MNFSFGLKESWKKLKKKKSTFLDKQNCAKKKNANKVQ